MLRLIIKAGCTPKTNGSNRMFADDDKHEEDPNISLTGYRVFEVNCKALEEFINKQNGEAALRLLAIEVFTPPAPPSPPPKPVEYTPSNASSEAQTQLKEFLANKRKPQRLLDRIWNGKRTAPVVINLPG